MLDIDWVGLSVPFAYIAVLAGSLMTFSSIYRKRKAGEFSSFTAYCIKLNILQCNLQLLLHGFPPICSEMYISPCYTWNQRTATRKLQRYQKVYFAQRFYAEQWRIFIELFKCELQSKLAALFYNGEVLEMTCGSVF
jgi:hypothetical protein